MDVKEKLVELVNYARDSRTGQELAERIADHLLANGVIVQELDSCKYCEEYEDLPEHFVNGKPVGKIFDTTIQTDENGLWHIEACGVPDIGIKFCPMCGRRLPQPPKGE